MNLFWVAFNVIILTGLIFLIVGEALNPLLVTVTGFILMFIPSVLFILSVNVIVDSRLAYIEGKWELKEGEPKGEIGELTNPWRRVTVEVLLFGIGAALPICAIFWVIGIDPLPFSPFSTLLLMCVIVDIPTLILSFILIKRHLYKDLASFTAAMKQPKQERPEPFIRYFLLEHIVPWMTVIGVMNIVINLKSFIEKETVTGGGVLVADVIWGVLFTAVIIVIWMWMSAMSQVKSDIHLGRVSQGKTISLFFRFLIVGLAPLLIIVVVSGPLLIAGITHLSMVLSTLLIVVIAMVSTVIGRALGIWWVKSSKIQQTQAMRKEVTK